MKRLIIISLVLGISVIYFWNKVAGKDKQAFELTDAVEHNVSDQNMSPVNRAKNVQVVLDNAAADKKDYLDSVSDD